MGLRSTLPAWLTSCSRRSFALLGLVAVHALALLGLIQARTAVPVPVPEPIAVQLLAVQEIPEFRPAPLTAALPSLPRVELPMPVVPLTTPVADSLADAVTAPVPAIIPVAGVPEAADTSLLDGASAMPRQVAEVAYVRPPLPRYPVDARRARAQGLVLLRVLVDAQGRASAVSLHRSSGHAALDAAARTAVLAALFKPYEENGRAQSAVVIVPIEFSLALRTASTR
jgi:protein TonB